MVIICKHDIMEFKSAHSSGQMDSLNKGKGFVISEYHCLVNKARNQFKQKQRWKEAQSEMHFSGA